MTFRIVKTKQGKTRLYQIVDGMVAELVPTAKDKKREPGYYDADFKLTQAETPPWLK